MYSACRFQMVPRVGAENGISVQDQTAETHAATDNECDNVREGLYPYHAHRRRQEFMLSTASTSV